MRFLPSLVFGALCAFVGPAAAQQYPDKPIRFVVPYAAGGGTDVLARIVAQEMSESLGQPITVDNRGGANGAIGATLVAKAPNDGYTLLFGAAGALVIGPHLMANPGFDTIKDFAPVSLVALTPFAVTLHPSVPAGSLAELTALAKSKPGALNYGTSGNGGAPHLATELYKSMAGIDIVHVPYKGLGPAITDLLGAQVQLVFADLGLVTSHIKAGSLKALAVTSAQRSPLLPEVPTMEEAGLKGYQANTWYGLLAPAGTPTPILAKLYDHAAQALAKPGVREKFAGQGSDPVGNTPEQYAAIVRTDWEKWGKLIRETGIKAE